MPTTTVEIVSLINNIATLNLGYLGIAITILIFLGGGFYLFNVKPLKDGLDKQEKTLDELKNEVEKNLSSSKVEMREEMQSFKKDQLENLSNLANQRDQKLLSEMKIQIAEFEKDFTKKFDDFATQKDVDLKNIILATMSDKIRDLEKNLSVAINENKSRGDKEMADIKTLVNSLKKELKDTKRTVRMLEVYKYSQEGKMGAIYGTIDLLKDDIDENSWRIDGTLEDLNKEIEGARLEGEIITRIEEQLVRLNDKVKYLPLVTKIRKHYSV